MKAIFFDGDSGESTRIEDVPDDMKDFCIEKKLELIGTLAEFDEQMEEYYMDEVHDVPV